MTSYKGKAIYTPTGKAAEYARWACNFYVGCSNGCEYCYCKKGILAGAMGGDKPTLKKCFRNESFGFINEDRALDVFRKEMMLNKSELQNHGLFFSFSTDPMLPETKYLTMQAVESCLFNNIPVKILTKCVDWMIGFDYDRLTGVEKEIAFGFTLTGHDELEFNASTNQERIEGMRALHDAGFKTFASIEPIIDFGSSLKMVYKTTEFCDLYKIGLKSGEKYNKNELNHFIYSTGCVCESGGEGTTTPYGNHQPKIYFKDSLLKQARLLREYGDLPICSVDRDYNLFS